MVESTDLSGAVPDDENVEPSGESIEVATENGIPPESELPPDGAEITTLCDPYRKPDIESGKYQVSQFIFCMEIFQWSEYIIETWKCKCILSLSPN